MEALRLAFGSVACAYLGLTIIAWAWGLIVRFRYSGVRWQVFSYHNFASILALDVFYNRLQAGNVDMTISARLGIAARRGVWWGRLGAYLLGLIQPNHCSMAIQNDEYRAEWEAKFLARQRR